MYCDKDNVNILTALLVEHGIRHAVVCPGSRNAPIVHNLAQCPDICCWPVTDEHSAAFYALGMAQALDEPVAVCVTSGTALLNMLPAVAEAHHQHQSLTVISADRPAAWIGQLDGQTLMQPGALQPWVAMSVTLPEPHDAVTRWHCNRLVNEALIEATTDRRPCVHINVPISEPLFNFSLPALPQERTIERFVPPADYDCLCQRLVDDMTGSERPMVIFGQMKENYFARESADYLFSHVTVLHESLASFPSVCHIDEVLAHGCDDSLLPDFVLYVGGSIVSKRLKTFIRRASDARIWRVNTTGEVEDTFQSLCGVVVGDAEFVLQSLSNKLAKHHSHKAKAYRREWLRLLTLASRHADSYSPPFSQMAVVRMFEERLSKAGRKCHVHYANSSAIRLANIYARHHVWCNRGVNGIEGSLSTAAGFAVAKQWQAVHDEVSNLASDGHATEQVFCVIGDLSFFYDQNALWNQCLGGNLRILLLNNGQGAIFSQLPGLGNSPVAGTMVAGRHSTSAKGICCECDIEYMQATDQTQVEQGLSWLVDKDTLRSKLLEVVTTPEADTEAVDQYYKLFIR